MTKTNPGRWNCYADAAPDEPMFTLLGRDDRAPALVEAWADASVARGTDPAKVAEARACAAAMRAWREKPAPTLRIGVSADLPETLRRFAADLDAFNAVEHVYDGQSLRITIGQPARLREAALVVEQARVWGKALHGRQWATATRALDALYGVLGLGTMHTRVTKSNGELHKGLVDVLAERALRDEADVLGQILSVGSGAQAIGATDEELAAAVKRAGALWQVNPDPDVVAQFELTELSALTRDQADSSKSFLARAEGRRVLGGTCVVCDEPRSSYCAKHEPGPTLEALRRYLTYCESDVCVGRRGDGSPISAGEMVQLLERRDPDALRFLEDLHGAALRVVRVAAKQGPRCGARSWRGRTCALSPHGDQFHEADGVRWMGDARDSANGTSLPPRLRSAYLALVELFDGVAEGPPTAEQQTECVAIYQQITDALFETCGVTLRLDDGHVYCTCAAIQAKDSLRHFTGCPKRALLPEGHAAKATLEGYTMVELRAEVARRLGPNGSDREDLNVPLDMGASEDAHVGRYYGIVDVEEESAPIVLFLDDRDAGRYLDRLNDVENEEECRGGEFGIVRVDAVLSVLNSFGNDPYEPLVEAPFTIRTRDTGGVLVGAIGVAVDGDVGFDGSREGDEQCE